MTDWVNRTDMDPAVFKRLAGVISDIKPSVVKMANDVGRPLSEVAMIVVAGPNIDTVFMLFEQDKHKEFVAGLERHTRKWEGLEDEIVRLLETPADGMLRTLLVYLVGEDFGMARLRIQIGKGPLS